MSFKKNKYVVIKQAIDKDLSLFLYNYLIMKRQVFDTCLKTKYISPFEKILGTWEDGQIPNTYSCYSDIAMETLMLKCQPIMEKATKLKMKTNIKEILNGNELIHFRPQPGTLIIFPGYLEHEFSIDFGIESFRFIHWNIQAVPKEMAKDVV